ncbi:FAD-binding domain-containing protein [Ephemerocybe angulata]|uniref:FAD-binding domain-containing protein n=1 Tax=Ephemerocybe angulata TaxID=980116 RepID=A0A8H6M2K5_9AGAR|nr:FAD-binding domain-containing protein [Tulosesus angulatus]
MVRKFAFTLALLATARYALASSVVTNVDAPQVVEKKPGQTANYTEVCTDISGAISPENVIYPGASRFQELAGHYVVSSSQDSACVVEPKNSSDVGRILKIVGRTKTPFAVKSGGHASNPGWSSTKGVHISLNGFRTIEYNAIAKTVEFGTGLKWEEVYAALDPHGVSVVGGRVAGVGVGGLTLGGGYAWRTNQFGLTIDTVTAFELVKPNGEVVKVTEKSDPELFFGLKGAQNNFGVVTKLTLKAFPQGQVWGGMLTYAIPDTFAAVASAGAKFSAEVKDPKASLLSTVSYFNNTPIINVFPFYDGPSPPAGIFDTYLSIPSVANTIKTQSFVSFVTSIPGEELNGKFRGYFLGLSVPEYSDSFQQLVNKVAFDAGAELTPKSLVFMTLATEPFHPDILKHTTSPSAFPFTRTKMYTPFNLFLQWADPSQDAVFEAAIKKMRDTLESALVAEGHKDVKTAPLYSNYALWDTPLNRIYGSNLPKLKAIKARVDPGNVMGLAGGFKF